MNKTLLTLAVLAAVVATTWILPAARSGGNGIAQAAEMAERVLPADGEQSAIFAGGCFWCMEKPFDKLDGVRSTISGYIGGHTENPDYRSTSSGNTGHTEAVEVIYDPAKVSYEKLLEVFWVNIDPTVKNRQFCDRGSQYRSGIFPHDDAQKAAAEKSRDELAKNKPFEGDIVTEITPATTFYPAEVYHQDYYLKNPVRYSFYRSGCGRDARLQELWGDAASH
ncbi:MAG: peptide-methionine (S)-S-oxide reductase MsrA [Burkholderiaceae bacterium]